jgi:hypothetical protein
VEETFLNNLGNMEAVNYLWPWKTLLAHPRAIP